MLVDLVIILSWGRSIVRSVQVFIVEFLSRVRCEDE